MEVAWYNHSPVGYEATAGFKQANGILLTPEEHKLAAEQLVPRLVDVPESLGG